MSQDDFDDEIAELKADLKESILAEARRLIMTEADEMCDGKIEEVQETMTNMLE